MLFKNYLITIASRVAGAVAAFLALPILLEHLGPSEYSLIVFASLVQGYANILDAGLSPMLAANVAKHSESHDQALLIIKAAIRAFMMKFSKYALPLYGLLTVTAWVMLPNVSLERLALLCAILMLDILASAILRLQYSALQGFGNHTIANSMYSLNIVVRVALAVGISVYSHQVDFIFTAQALVTVATTLATYRYYSSRSLQSTMRVYKGDIRNAEVSVTRDLTIIAIFLAIINSIPLIVLGQFGNTNELNHFFLAASLGGIIATLQSSLISVLIPSLSQELATPPSDNHNWDFRRISYKVVSVSFMVVGLAFCLAEVIVSVWIRKSVMDFTLLTTLFRFQLISAAFVSLTIVPYALSIPLRQTRIQLIGVGIYLLACCVVMPIARYLGNIEIFGLMSMLLGICFSIGYFLASSYLIHPNAGYSKTLTFIAEPLLYIGIALIGAYLGGKELSSLSQKPSWLISSVIFLVLIGITFTHTKKITKDTSM